MSNSPSSSNHPDKAGPGERAPVEVLAESFLARLRRGERPSVSEYAEAHPEHAEEIRAVFPTLAFIEDLGADESLPTTTKGVHAPLGSLRQIGEYRVIREIGRGGMGIVYEAEHVTMRRRVALKVLPSESAARGSNLQRFLRETRVAGRLHHTNIVPVFEVGVEDGIHYYSMQYIRGQSLDVVINELRLLRDLDQTNRKQSDENHDHSLSQTIARGLVSEGFVQSGLNEDGKDDFFNDKTVVSARPFTASLSEEPVVENFPDIPPSSENEPVSSRTESSDLSSLGSARDSYFQRVARVGLQVTDALMYAHSHKVLHRDIKPSNLILDAEGVIWITDFGLAKHQEETFTDTGDVVGTLRYMSPEQFRGEAETRSDIYSLGLTLYELCTLKYAYDESDRARLVQQVALVDPPHPRLIDKRIPRDLETIILKAISKHPNDRYQTAQHITDDLRLFLEDRPIRARRIYFWERAWRRCRRNPLQAILTGCVALLLLVVFLGSLNFSINSQKQAELLRDENQRFLFAESEARKAETVARKSEQKAKKQLYGQLRTQIELAPLMRLSGKRTQGIEAVVQAEQLLPQLEMSKPQMEADRLSLRNDAIAVFSLFDVSEVVRKKIESPWTNTLVFSFSHKLYAQSDVAGNIAIRNVEDDQQTALLPGFGNRAARLIFSPDDRFLSAVYTGSQPVMYVWDITNQKTVLEIEDSVTKGRTPFSSDSQRIPVGFKDGHVRIYRLPEGTIDQEFQTDGQPSTFNFSPMDRKIAITSYDQSVVTLRDLTSGETTQFDCESAVMETAWLPEGMLAGGCWNGDLVLWNCNKSASSPIVLEAHTAPIFRIRSSPRGKLLVSFSSDGSVRFWNMNDYREELRVESVSLLNCDFSHDGRFLGFLTEDNHFGVWQLSDQSPWKVFRNHETPTIRWSASYSPHSGRLLASATDLGVEIWDTQLDREVAFLPIDKTRSSVFSSDGTSLITSSEDRLQQWPVRFSDNESGRVTIGPPVVIRKGHVRRASVDADSKRVAYVMGFRKAFLTEFQQDRPLSKLIGEHKSLAYSLISPDGQWVVTTTWQGTGIRIWDAASGKLIRDLKPDSGSASPAFSPDGRFLAAGNGADIFIWSVGTWECLHHIKKRVIDSSPEPMAFSPDGRLLAAPYSRFRVQLIDTHTGITLAILQAPLPKGLNFAGSFSPDGMHFAHTAGEEIHVWDLALLHRQLGKINLAWPDFKKSEIGTQVTHDPLSVEVLLHEVKD